MERFPDALTLVKQVCFSFIISSVAAITREKVVDFSYSYLIYF